MSDGDRRGATFSIPEKYFQDCVPIETQAFIKSTQGRAVILVEPHPDDAILGAGGFLQHILQEKHKLSARCPVAVVTAVTGSHAVTDQFVAMLSEKERQDLLLKYENSFAWFLSAAGDSKDVKEYYLQCVKNIKALRRGRENKKLFNIILKGGLRTFIETERVFAALGNDRMIDHYSAFLPFYDPLIGGEVDVGHPANEFAMKTIMCEIMRRAGTRKILVFNDCGLDPHRTHAKVRRVLDKAMAVLVEKDEIEEVTYFWMRGPWPMMHLRGGEKMRAAFLGKKYMDRKERALREYVSQRDPLVTDRGVKDFTVRVKEDNFTFAQNIKKHVRRSCALDDHAEIFFVREFMNKRGDFDKDVFMAYVKKGEE